MNQPETEIDLFPLMNQKPTFEPAAFNKNLYQSDMEKEDLDSAFDFLIPTIVKSENDKEYANKLKEYLHGKMKGNWCVVVGSEFYVICWYCGELETTEHLFLHCEFAQKVWNLAPFSAIIDPLTLCSFTNTLVKSKDWICLPPTGIGSGPLFPWICWALWKARNHLIFEERSFSPTETMNKAIVEAKEWQQAQSEPQKQTQRHAQSIQIVTPPNTILCFTDGAWSEENGIGGLGWVFVDGEGTNIDSGQGAERFVFSPLMAEALSIRSALHHALEKGISRIHLKSDAQEVIRAITKHEQVKELYGVLFDIKTLASMFVSITFSYIPRSENTIADTIAKIAKSRLVSLLSLWDPLDVIAN